MRALCIVSLIMLSPAIGGAAANAQGMIGDVPPGFFEAQRGRVVAHRHGGFRMRYGRGLTPQGADVLTTAITTLGPLVPGIFGPLGSLPDPSLDAGFMPSKTMVCEPYQDDEFLDSLADPTEHAQRVSCLDDLSLRTAQLVRGFGKTPVERKPPVIQDAGIASGGADGAPVSVRGGVRINPPRAVATPRPLQTQARPQAQTLPRAQVRPQPQADSGVPGAPMTPAAPACFQPATDASSSPHVESVQPKVVSEKEAARHARKELIKKLETAEAAIAAGKDVAETLQALGISEETYRHWQSVFRDDRSNHSKKLVELEKTLKEVERLRGELEQVRQKLKTYDR